MSLLVCVVFVACPRFDVFCFSGRLSPLTPVTPEFCCPLSSMEISWEVSVLALSDGLRWTVSASALVCVVAAKSTIAPLEVRLVRAVWLITSDVWSPQSRRG